MILLEACMHAPLIAVSRRHPKVLHAAEMDTIVKSWPDGTVTAACGATRLRLISFHQDSEGGALPTLWPPRVKGMPDQWARCKACHEATGKKRPRTQWAEQLDGGPDAR